MADPAELDLLLADWPYRQGIVSARRVATAGGREVLQMRIELGIIQMETSGRPDGRRPEGFQSYLDHLIQRALIGGDRFCFTPTDRDEVDSELAQYHQRRMAYIALRDFAGARRDAEHSLTLLGFITKHCDDDHWVRSHKRFQPLVLFHFVQADAMSAVVESGPEGAVERLTAGRERMLRLFRDIGQAERGESDPMIRQLSEMADRLREEFDIDRTLGEQLAEAIADEQYELAAELRDAIAQRDHANKA